MAGTTPPLASLFALAALLMAPPLRAEVSPEPKFLRKLDRAVNAGDWTLQCDSAQFCQIIGVVAPTAHHTRVRAVVMIERGVAADAVPRLRMAFVDSAGGLAEAPPREEWRLIPRGRRGRSVALPLGLGAREPDGAYRAAPETAARIIATLRRWWGSTVHDGERTVARMPRGNLDWLMRRMDRLQHPATDPLTPAERAQWLKQYHYTVLRSEAAEDRVVPDAVANACSARTVPTSPFVYRIGPKHRLWIAECPEGNHIFLHPDGADPIHFELRDKAGVVQRHDYAGFGGDSLLVLQLPLKERVDCGHWLKFGFSGEVFQVILQRRYSRCRMVPYDFWPKVWYPTSWRYADAPPLRCRECARPRSRSR